ncbi:MAG: DNA/RNA non-specific endonuclease [Lachnospiraceae bacterium]|nr:DNA/RNA non-specific endonuclease [Lachnospiraceae bacterium]
MLHKFRKFRLLSLLGLCLSLALCGCSVEDIQALLNEDVVQTQDIDATLSDDVQDDETDDSSDEHNGDTDNDADSAEQTIRKSHEEYTGEPYGILNDNQPEFTEKEKKNTKAFETYTRLDKLGRCGVAYANICEEIMPTEKRGAIGSVKPSGWHTVKYDVVDGKYLYNRCHLIGFQLAGENANKKNLITGTRYLNVDGMLPFEDDVADYVKESGNHVLYRVTPVYEGDNLLAEGVQMEAYSVEDAGEGICFNVFVYNVQPGVHIEYDTGESRLE